MRLTNRIARGPHVEDNAAVLKQRSGWMIGQVVFDCLGQLAR